MGIPARTLSAAVLLLAVELGGAPPINAAVRHMFVTSESHDADLSAWLAALNGDTRSGADAADAICRFYAAKGGLPDAAGFRAWLSTTNDDAYCRLLRDQTTGAGQRASFCGLPKATYDGATAGPWWRADGTPFALGIAAMVDHDGVLNPPGEDETGKPVFYAEETWTGSAIDGTVVPGETCEDWTSTADPEASRGRLEFTAELWGSGAGAACDTPAHLLCFETGVGDPIATQADPGDVVFVSAAHGPGDFADAQWGGPEISGIAGADAICQQEAAAADLADPSSFRAYLSTGATAAPARLNSNGPWKRVDGTRIAWSKSDLLDGTLLSTIHQLADGTYVDDLSTWTGADDHGVAAATTCQDWTSSSAADTSSSGGAAQWIDGWSGNASSTTKCDALLRVYCFSDARVDFYDRFETGALDRWSAQSP